MPHGTLDIAGAWVHAMDFYVSVLHVIYLRMEDKTTAHGDVLSQRSSSAGIDREETKNGSCARTSGFPR